MDSTPPISGTTYQNIRADEIIKKYHNSNTDVQQKVISPRVHGGVVSPRQIDFDRNVGSPVSNLNGSFVSE
jgi:hypothetical protein